MSVERVNAAIAKVAKTECLFASSSRRKSSLSTCDVLFSRVWHFHGIYFNIYDIHTKIYREDSSSAWLGPYNDLTKLPSVVIISSVACFLHLGC